MALWDEMDQAIKNLRSCIRAQGEAVDLLESVCHDHFGVKISIPKPNTQATDGALKAIEHALKGTAS